MEHGPFIDDFPSYKPPFIRDFIYKGFSMAMLNHQMVYTSGLIVPIKTHS